jgi:hypothetical protein
MALAGTSATFPRQRLMQNFTLCEIPPMGGGLLAGAPERRSAGASAGWLSLASPAGW